MLSPSAARAAPFLSVASGGRIAVFTPRLIFFIPFHFVSHGAATPFFFCAPVYSALPAEPSRVAVSVCVLVLVLRSSRFPIPPYARSKRRTGSRTAADPSRSKTLDAEGGVSISRPCGEASVIPSTGARIVFFRPLLKVSVCARV